MFKFFAILVAVHGLVHILGAAKAFHWAELAELTRPISPLFGALWLLSALLFVTASVALAVWPRKWWAVGLAGVIVSTIVIVPTWTDAKLGMVANVAVLIGVALGFLSAGPASLRARTTATSSPTSQVCRPAGR